MASQLDSKSPAMSEGKKRAFKALEERYAPVKDDVVQEQHRRSKKNRREPMFDDAKTKNKEQPDVSLSSSSKPGPVPQKGHLVFSGFTPRRETSGPTDQLAHPAYSELPCVVNENLLRGSTEASSKGEAVNKVVLNLLQSGDKGHKYIRGAKSLKVDNWLLLDNFVPKDTASIAARVRAVQSHSNRSRKHMTMRQHRKCGSFDLPNEFRSFDRFKPMHDMWKEYIMELLKESVKKQLPQCLLMADLHGAILQVVECKTTAFRGVTGIMIRETTETFGIITQDNKFRVVPKRGSVFIFQADCWKITLHGDKLSLRNTGI